MSSEKKFVVIYQTGWIEQDPGCSRAANNYFWNGTETKFFDSAEGMNEWIKEQEDTAETEEKLFSVSFKAEVLRDMTSD